MPSIESVGIVVLAALAWFWLDSIRVRETAVEAARTACNAEGVMLLDDTVAISALKLARNERGRLQFQRAYDFEYTDTGNNRLKGGIVLLGREVIMVNVGLRERKDPRLDHHMY